MLLNILLVWYLIMIFFQVNFLGQLEHFSSAHLLCLRSLYLYLIVLNQCASFGHLPYLLHVA